MSLNQGFFAFFFTCHVEKHDYTNDESVFSPLECPTGEIYLHGGKKPARQETAGEDCKHKQQPLARLMGQRQQSTDVYVTQRLSSLFCRCAPSTQAF